MFGFGKKPAPAAPAPTKVWDIEFDIEHMPVMSIERDEDDQTVIFFNTGSAWYLDCDEAKHADFLRRFRLKINKPEPTPAPTTKADEGK
jgi:hypothetical protein